MTSEQKLQQQLKAIIERVYERRRDQISVNPSWLATEAMQEIDPEKKSPELAYRAAHLQLRQMARGLCRKQWEDDTEDSERDQHELFPDLQRRYPTARSSGWEEPEYILLEHLTKRDVDYNVVRLRREGATKLRRADALEAWGHDKFTERAAE